MNSRASGTRDTTPRPPMDQEGHHPQAANPAPTTPQPCLRLPGTHLADIGH